MLSGCRKGHCLTGTPPSPAENGWYEKLSAALQPEFRQAGTEIVQRYQNQGHSSWFLGGCLGSQEKGLQNA